MFQCTFNRIHDLIIEYPQNSLIVNKIDTAHIIILDLTFWVSVYLINFIVISLYIDTNSYSIGVRVINTQCYKCT